MVAPQDVLDSLQVSALKCACAPMYEVRPKHCLLCRQVSVRLPPGYQPGAVMLEVLRGGFVSDLKPVLVLESAAAVADIERLDVAKPAGALLLGSGNAWCPGAAGCQAAGSCFVRLALHFRNAHAHLLEIVKEGSCSWQKSRGRSRPRVGIW